MSMKNLLTQAGIEPICSTAP